MVNEIKTNIVKLRLNYLTIKEVRETKINGMNILGYAKLGLAIAN